MTLGVGTFDAWSFGHERFRILMGQLGFAAVCSHCVADGTLNISATPLPSTWGMMLLGLGVLGFMGYRRRRTMAWNAA